MDQRLPSCDTGAGATGTARGIAPARVESPLSGLVAAIQQGIRGGRYVPGQRLIEADLAAEFSAKRTVVRDALRVLAGDGIVELVPQKGARIRRLTQEDLRAIVPVLGGLLRTTLGLAVGRIHEAPGVRERLDAAHAAMRHACLQRDFEQFQVASLRYTEALHAAAANHYLDYLHAKLYPDLFHKQLATAVHDVDWPRHLAHVDSLHAALCAGDLAQALALVDAHETHMQAIFAGIGTGVPTR